LPSTALAHGDRVPRSEVAAAWSAPPTVLAGSAIALALFAQAFIRLRRRGRQDYAGWDRAALFAAGVVVATLALVSPLDAIGEEYLFSAHMLEHVLIGDLAPALLLVAIRGPLTFFLLPPWLLRPLARPAPLRRFLGQMLRPRVAVAFWALVYAFWHIPPAYDLTLENRLVHDLEHVSFVLAGVLVWSQLVDPARRRELTVGGRLALAAVLFTAGQVLAYVLIFSFSPLYGPYAAQDERLLGLSPLTDQRLAGVAMMTEQLLTLGLCAVFLIGAYGRQRAAGLEQEAFSLAPRP
jgi:cytochrome c oxidase assembly factor CtaG